MSSLHLQPESERGNPQNCSGRAFDFLLSSNSKVKKMMKLLQYISVFLALTSAPAAAAFIEGLEDIPVMEGLHQLPSDALSFGNEESRLVEATLVGEGIKFASIEKFYQETLPQMGWSFRGRKKNSLTFYRDRESLEISRTSSHPLTIRITVKSKN